MANSSGPTCDWRCTLTTPSARGLDDGDDVRVFNELGEMRCRVNVTHLVRTGTVSFPKGVWRRHTANGFTSNALVPDTLTDFGGGACFNDARVQVASASRASGRTETTATRPVRCGSRAFRGRRG